MTDLYSHKDRKLNCIYLWMTDRKATDQDSLTAIRLILQEREMSREAEV